jgi:hypothetical protein
LTGSIAEEGSIAAQRSRERVFAIGRTFDHFAKNTLPVGFVIVVLLRKVLLRKTWQISEGLSGDNEAIRVDGFGVPQHQKRVLVKNLLR